MTSSSSRRDLILTMISELEDLPTLPGIAQKAIELSQDPEVSFSELSKLIHTDPPLVAKFMRLAGSSYYGRRIPVKTLDQAIITIGLDEVVAVCGSVGVLKAFCRWEAVHLERNRLWMHSFATATLARVLSRQIMKEKNCPSLYLAGMVHNIGWIVFDHLVPDLLAASLETAMEIDEWSLEIEHEVIGVDHAEAGYHFLKHWGLEEDICEIVAHHHAPEHAGILSIPTALVQLSASLSKNQLKLEPSLHAVMPELSALLVEKVEGDASLSNLQSMLSSHVQHAIAMAEMFVG